MGLKNSSGFKNYEMDSNQTFHYSPRFQEDCCSRFRCPQGCQEGCFQEDLQEGRQEDRLQEGRQEGCPQEGRRQEGRPQEEVRNQSLTKCVRLFRLIDNKF